MTAPRPVSPQDAVARLEPVVAGPLRWLTAAALFQVAELIVTRRDELVAGFFPSSSADVVTLFVRLMQGSPLALLPLGFARSAPSPRASRRTCTASPRRWACAPSCRHCRATPPPRATRPPARSAEPRFPTGHRGFGESLDLGGFSPGAPPASGSRR